MRIHVVCTGTELLIGQTLNTNLLFLGEKLTEAGYAIAQERCVPDAAGEIAGAVAAELQQADIVITIGGLGPTSDDLTRDVVAAHLGVKLHFDPTVYDTIVAYLAGRHVQVPEAALRVQAMVPDGATVLPNRNGTAPGLWCPAPGGKAVVMLPGPPRELQPMFLESVLPRLQARGPAEVFRRAFHLCGIPESTAAEKVEQLLRDFPGIEPAYCAQPYQVTVRLSAKPANREAVETAWKQLVNAFGTAVLPAGAGSLAAAVGALLLERRWWLGTAESCTGGGIAAAVTEVPGASAFFLGGLVTYANTWKSTLLNVRDETLSQHGAVSAEAAGQMLDALFRRYEVDAGIAVTGIAGPSGGTPEKPVGLVYVATGLRSGKAQIEKQQFPGNRETVRARTVTVALNQLRLQLLDVR